MKPETSELGLEIQRCREEQAWMLEHFGPMTSGKLDQIGHMDWLLEEIMLMKEAGEL